MKHLSDYTRAEIVACLNTAVFWVFEEDTTEKLRESLDSFQADGDAPTIEEINLLEWEN